MVSQALNDALTKAHDAASNSVADITPHMENVRDTLSSSKERALNTANDVRASGKKWARSAMSEASDLYDNARDYASEHAASAVRTARSHPMMTVAVAAGIGLLIGSLFMLNRRR